MKRTIEIDVNPTPEELARVFCNMFDDEQSMFMNEIARITDKWESPFCFQLQSMVDNDVLTDRAKYIMKQFGEYSGYYE